MQISDNTKAILLLTAPLRLGKNKEVPLLNNKEYQDLTDYLKSINKQPLDLLTKSVEDILRGYERLDIERVHLLLGRGLLLGQVLDYWHSRNIWVISRADKAYPTRLKQRLGKKSPPILYGCGDIHLLNLGGLAIVGSRNIDNALINYTTNVAKLSAQAGKMVISGGAAGADISAMRAALDAGGMACGVLANELEKAALSAENRLALQEGRLVLVSATDPQMHFSTGYAMQRNKYIYALSDAGLIIDATLEKGGTWAGAIEQLDKYTQIPIYVRSTGKTSKGLEALSQKGALLWKNPSEPNDFLKIFDAEIMNNAEVKKVAQLSIFDMPLDESLNEASPVTSNENNEFQHSELPAEILLNAVKELLVQLLQEPKQEKQLAELLDVSSAQMKKWLAHLVEEKVIFKHATKPIKYSLNSHQ